MTPPSIHAGAIRLGGHGVLLRGPAGSGKSMLALALVDRTRTRGIAADIVADDRTLLSVEDGRLIASPPEALDGLVELRGRGILPLAAGGRVALDLVVDLLPEAQITRLPEADALGTVIGGIALQRQPVPARNWPVSVLLVEAALGLIARG